MRGLSDYTRLPDTLLVSLSYFASLSRSATMSILSNPRTLYFTRIVQLLFGIGFLVLVCDAGVHRGWWDNINGALAVGGTYIHIPSPFDPYRSVSIHDATHIYTIL